LRKKGDRNKEKKKVASMKRNCGVDAKGGGKWTWSLEVPEIRCSPCSCLGLEERRGKVIIKGDPKND